MTAIDSIRRPIHLYTASMHGSRPVERVSAIEGLDAVQGYGITSDSRHVVFSAYRTVHPLCHGPDSSFLYYVAWRSFPAMYALALEDGAPRVLSVPTPHGGGVVTDFVPLQGGRVLYRQDTDGVIELFEGFARNVLPGPH